jgi:hypothetical protein
MRYGKKRNLFAELMKGVTEMKAQREGSIILRSHKIESRPRKEKRG